MRTPGVCRVCFFAVVIIQGVSRGRDKCLVFLTTQTGVRDGIKQCHEIAAAFIEETPKYGGLSTALRFGRDDEFFGLIFGLLLDLILKIDLPLEWMNWSGWI